MSEAQRIYQNVYQPSEPATPSAGKRRATAWDSTPRPAWKFDREGRVPIEYEHTRVGRNKRCPCGSGRKFKHCHLLEFQGRN